MSGENNYITEVFWAKLFLDLFCCFTYYRRWKNLILDIAERTPTLCCVTNQPIRTQILLDKPGLFVLHHPGQGSQVYESRVQRKYSP